MSDEPAPLITFSKRAMEALVKNFQSNNVTVNSRGDGTSSLSLSKSKPVEFKTQPVGTYELKHAQETGYDEAATEYAPAIETMLDTINTYQQTLHEQIKHAREYSTEIPASSQAKVESIRQQLDSLQSIAPPVKKYGYHCNDLRAAVYKCYQNNPQNPLVCSDVVNAFSACVEK